MRFGSTLRRLAALSLVTYAAVLPAQNYDISRDRQAMISLDGPWHFQLGDSPRVDGSQTPLWATPAFDDSGWALIKSSESWASQGHPAMSGYGWYRFTIKLPTGQKPVSLLLAPIVSAFEVYVDGRLVGGSGNMPPRAMPATEFSYHLFPLTQDVSVVDRTVQVAIRVWHSPIWSNYVGGGPFQSGHLVGDPKQLAAEQHQHQLARNVVFVDLYAYSISAGITGLAILWLFFIRPSEREYLWFAAMLLAQAADCVLNICHEIWAVPPIPVFDLADGILNAMTLLGVFCFLALILKARIGLGGRILIGLVLFSPLPGVFYWPGWLSVPASAALQLICALPSIVWMLYLLVRRAIQGNKDARLLLVPILLAEGYYVADNLVVLLAQAGWVTRPEVMERPLPLPPFTVHIQILLNLVFLLAMLVFLIRRFTLARRQEERLASEFEAARQVQQVLLPDELDRCPGFNVESVYQPADEVGGDFFQQIADGRCGMLIVIGDVSGKGLPAAMMVSVLVGAIRAEASRGTDPAKLLQSLNDRMVGRSQGGFTTCLAAHFTAEGELTLANAGHPAPYLNGEEISIPGALPLGIVPHAQYEITTVPLAPGDRLTFISDGVVEAQSRSGQLFGFDRTKSISRRPAAQIAESARAFGQLDDITVVTIEFAGVALELAGSAI
jgi:hypothetical protein